MISILRYDFKASESLEVFNETQSHVTVTVRLLTRLKPTGRPAGAVSSLQQSLAESDSLPLPRG